MCLVGSVAVLMMMVICSGTVLFLLPVDGFGAYYGMVGYLCSRG